MKLYHNFILFLLVFSFWFNGNKLYWTDGKNNYQTEFSMDFKQKLNEKSKCPFCHKEIPQEKSLEPIEYILIKPCWVDVYTKNFKWTLMDINKDMTDWYIERRK